MSPDGRRGRLPAQTGGRGYRRFRPHPPPVSLAPARGRTDAILLRAAHRAENDGNPALIAAPSSVQKYPGGELAERPRGGNAPFPPPETVFSAFPNRKNGVHLSWKRPGQ